MARGLKNSGVAEVNCVHPPSKREQLPGGAEWCVTCGALRRPIDNRFFDCEWAVSMKRDASIKRREKMRVTALDHAGGS